MTSSPQWPKSRGVRHADICWAVPDMFVEAEAADAKGLKLLTSSDSAVRGRGAYRNSYRRGVRRTELVRERIRSRAPLLLTITADVRPGHRFQPRLRDRAGAGITHPKGALRDSSQCLFDCPQQVSIALAQMGLERRLGFLSRTIRRDLLAVPPLCPPPLKFRQDWATTHVAWPAKAVCTDLSQMHPQQFPPSRG